MNKSKSEVNIKQSEDNIIKVLSLRFKDLNNGKSIDEKIEQKTKKG